MGQVSKQGGRGAYTYQRSEDPSRSVLNESERTLLGSKDPSREVVKVSEQTRLESPDRIRGLKPPNCDGPERFASERRNASIRARRVRWDSNRSSRGASPSSRMALQAATLSKISGRSGIGALHPSAKRTDLRVEVLLLLLLPPPLPPLGPRIFRIGFGAGPS